ncbi:MAG: hypothetical protein QW597_04875 [Thermoplasmataceae archaeon]
MSFSYGIIVSGISIVISIFLITVSLKGARKTGSPGILYVGIAFVIILLDNVIYTLSSLEILFSSQIFIPAFLVSDLIILLFFYMGAIRGR